MMSGITWIHLSDWHQRGKDFDREVVRDKLIADISQRAQISSDLNKIDFAIFSGDIAYNGLAAEYDAAINHFFNPLLQATGLGEAGRERLFIVPGNHDVNRDFLDVLPSDLPKKLNNSKAVNDWLTDDRKRGALLGPTAAYTNFISAYLGSHQNFADFDPGYWYIGRVEAAQRKLSILCFNSAWFCARVKDSEGEVLDYGNLILGEPQVHNALARTTDADIRVAVMHHPFS
jgi:hypothetical protein